MPALAVNNARDAVHRHIDLAREFGSRDGANLAQFFGKMFTGSGWDVRGITRAFFNGNRRSRTVTQVLMILLRAI